MDKIIWTETQGSTGTRKVVGTLSNGETITVERPGKMIWTDGSSRSHSVWERAKQLPPQTYIEFDKPGYMIVDEYAKINYRDGLEPFISYIPATETPQEAQMSLEWEELFDL